MSQDAESLMPGTTNKKDDSSMGYIRSTIVHCRSEILSRHAFLKYFVVPATIIFAVIGMVTVTEGISSYSHRERVAIESFSSPGDLPLETNDKNYNVFDGHMSKAQTRSISVFSQLVGVEPYGGPQTINKLMENVADVSAPFSIEDVPFFWEVAGEPGIGKKLCQCLDIKIASTTGNELLGDFNTLEPQAPSEGDKCHLYNVNLGTLNGISRAKSQGLITKEVPDFISSPFFPESASLFKPSKKARIFTSIPNTNARLKQAYDYLKRNKLFEGSFLQFVSSDHVLANNYLTHLFSGKWGGVVKLTEQDLDMAMQVLIKKTFVTRLADFKKVITYLIQNKHWHDDPEAVLECMYPPVDPWSNQNMANPRPPPPPKSPEELAADAAIAIHNEWDNKLFDLMNAHISEAGSII